MILFTNKGVSMDKIIRNRIKCKKCGDIIESKSVHDFVECRCRSIAVDGGHEYQRWVGNIEDIEDLSIVEKDNTAKRAQPQERRDNNGKTSPIQEN